MAETKFLFTPRHLTQIERLSDIQISRSMSRIVFTATHLNENCDKYLSTIYRIPFDLELRERSKIRIMTQRGKKDYHPRFAPHGELTFISTRDNDISQVFLIHSDGGESQQITNLLTGIRCFEHLPNGKSLIVESCVYPDLETQEENLERDELNSKLIKEGHEIIGYPIRSWDRYMGPKFPHLFHYDLSTHEIRDLTVGAKIDYIDRKWSISFDGKKIAVAFNTVGENLSVYSNIAIIDIETGERTAVTNEKHLYVNPKFSTDGTKILCEYKQIEKGKIGKKDIVIIDVKTKEVENITKDLDLWGFDADWVPYTNKIIFHTEIKGTTQIWIYSLKDRKAIPVVKDGHNYGTKVFYDGRNILYIHEQLDSPGDIYIKSIAHYEKPPRRLTNFNKKLLGKLYLERASFIETKGANDTPIQSLIVKPPNFNPDKKYPLLVFIHGGPYVSFRDRFCYRFNPQPYISEDYVVLKINARGSTGFGQKFIEENMGRWGDLGYKDIMKTIDELCKEPYIDSERMAVLGASFGGYMVNWIASQKLTADRFKCFVTFAGIYNLMSCYATTNLSYKFEHEFGVTPFKNQVDYAKWSPATYASNFKTPMLIVHGGKDYRVSYSESLQLYTVLSRKGVKCKLLFFKDEGHWIMQPNNYIFFYETVIDWVNQHLK